MSKTKTTNCKSAKTDCCKAVKTSRAKSNVTGRKRVKGTVTPVETKKPSLWERIIGFFKGNA